MDYKKALIRLLNAIHLRRPAPFVAEDESDGVLENVCANVMSEMRVAGPGPYLPAPEVKAGSLTPTDRKCYYAICMVHDPRGPSMIELILDEHPLIWVEGKKKELRDANVRAEVMVQFFSEIPREVYDLMKQPKSVIVEPTAKEKSLIIGGGSSHAI